MPGCCSKGTDSDLELRNRNAPTRKPPATGTIPDGQATTEKEPGSPGPKSDNADLGVGAGAGGGGAGAAKEVSRKNLATNDSDDDDDLPLIVEAVLEEKDGGDNEAVETRHYGWQLCLSFFLLCAIIAFVVFVIIYIFKNENGGGSAIRAIVVPAFVLRPTGICLSNPCQHLGACFAVPDRPSKYVCTCRTGFSGRNCSEPDPCGDRDPCKPQGKCLKDDEVASFTCFCKKGWEGKRCKVATIGSSPSLTSKPGKQWNNST